MNLPEPSEFDIAIHVTAKDGGLKFELRYPDSIDDDLANRLIFYMMDLMQDRETRKREEQKQEQRAQMPWYKRILSYLC